MEFPQDHTGSYYAASLNDQTDFPKLKGKVTADVCVVGAGFTGISTALHLAERDYNVVVVEANKVGWGASGRNGGQLIGGISGERKLVNRYGPSIADIIWDMRWAGHDIVRQRVEQYGISCDLKPGYIDVALKDRHLYDFQEEYDALAAHQFPHEFRMVSKEEVQDLLGTTTYIGGLLNMGNGHLHPLNLCIGEARAAKALGTKIFEQSPVVRIERGQKPVVHTADGEIEADKVVLAGNAYHELESRHLSGIVFPAGSFIIATEPLNDELVRQINPKDLAVCDANYVVDYYRLSADKRMLFGGRCNYSGRDPKSIQKTILPRMLKIYPQLEGVRIDYEWGGKIGVVINRIPAIGRTDKDVFYAQGYSGHGVNFTHVTGQIMADAVAGTFERFDVFDKINHTRIPGGQWFGNQLVAMGMVYYRLRDLL